MNNNIIPEKQDGPPLNSSLRKILKLDKLAKVLIGSGIGIALLAKTISTLTSDERTEKDNQTEEDDAQQRIQP